MTEYALRRRVPGDDAVLGVGGDDRIRRGGGNALHSGLGIPNLQFQPPGLQAIHNAIGKKAQRLAVAFGKFGAGLLVNNAQGAEGDAVRVAQGSPCVKADERLADDEAIRRKTRVQRCVGHNEDVAVPQRMATERGLPFGLADGQSGSCLEELPVLAHERDQGDRSI